MRELFDKLLAEGEDGIDRLVAERTQESVTLDFKEARGAGTGTLANEDRKTFGKALSAFSNSAGGLLVFGVEARKGDDNVDCAQEAKPINNIARFKSEATTASGQLLQPRHDGIVVEAIPSTRQPGAGYLLVHIERSERRPHRSEAAGQKQYFKRAGDSSFEMEHYDIEDAFNRVVLPDLSLHAVIDVEETNDNHYMIDFQLRLFNSSVKSGRNCYVQISNLSIGRVNFNSPTTFAHTLHAGVSMFSGMGGSPIHADVEMYVGSLLIRVPRPPITAANPLLLDGKVEFGWCYGCEDARKKSGQFSRNAYGLLNERKVLIG